jgi:hypothetical protein
VKEKPRSIKIRKAKPVRVRTIRLYLEPETYENIKATAEVKYISMSDVMRQVLGKMVISGGCKPSQKQYNMQPSFSIRMGQKLICKVQGRENNSE